MKLATLALSLSLTGAATTALADNMLTHEDMFEHYEGTATCLECHDSEAEAFFHSQHYQWRGSTPQVVNTAEGAMYGKLSLINDFCTNPGGSQWIGKVRNEQGKVLTRGCSACHAGLGELPARDMSQEQLENIDCLICHASGYRRDVYQDDNGNWEWRPILWKNQEGLDIISQRISKPTRKMCLRCHSTSGGGPNFKRGDIEYILRDPPRSHDVHMSADGADLNCVDCHSDDENSHRVVGRGVDMAASDAPGKHLTCEGACHDAQPHTSARLNGHTARVACVSCHIPAFARDEPTDMFRDWSQVRHDEEAGKYHYAQELQQNVTPVYAWFNGSSFIQVPGEEVSYNSDGQVKMAMPLGSREDPNAKIYPFKVHRAKLPVLNDKQWLAPVVTEMVFKDGDPDAAVRLAAKDLYGFEDISYNWKDTIRYMGIFHGVPSADLALRCKDCHGEQTRLDWQKLGYDHDPRKKVATNEDLNHSGDLD